MEPAIRIERTTCGLRISDSPTSDNLTPQETTKQDAPDMGADRAGLPCSDSSMVAQSEMAKGMSDDSLILSRRALTLPRFYRHLHKGEHDEIGGAHASQSATSVYRGI